MNRYITVLLVVLAATGVEAQKYESALKLALADMSYQEVLRQPEAQALEHDILSVIKALKQVSEEDFNKYIPSGHAVLSHPLRLPVCQQESTDTFSFSGNECLKNVVNTFFIRGPTV